LKKKVGLNLGGLTTQTKTFTTNGNHTFTLHSHDLANNTAEANGTILINPIQYFYFTLSNGTYITITEVGGAVTINAAGVGTDTNYYLSGITPSANSISLDVTGATNQTLSGATSSAAGLLDNSNQTVLGIKTATDWGNGSDRRLKENFKDLIIDIK
jgi:hypothetical protein